MTIVIEPTPHIASRLGDFMLLLVTLLFYASLLSLALIPIIPSYDETGGGATTHHKAVHCFEQTTCPTVSVSDGNLDMKLCNMTMGGGDSWQYKMQRFGGDIL